MKIFVKQTLHVLLAVCMALPTAANEPKEQAQRVIEASLEKARSDAQMLVRQDFRVAMMEVVSLSQQTPSRNGLSELYESQLNALRDASSDLASRLRANSDITSEVVKKFFEDYKHLVRERLGISFRIQYEYEQVNQMILAASAVLEKFEATCQAGRSEIGLNYRSGQLPNLPMPNTEIMIKYGWGQDASGLQFTGSTSTSVAKDPTLETIGAVLNTSAGVSTSIAVSGGGSATTAAMTVAAPWLVGAAIIFAAYSSYEGAERQARAQRQISEANQMILTKSAGDDDVVSFYRESCQSALTFTGKFKAMLAEVIGSEEGRSFWLKSAFDRSGEVDAFFAESEGMQKDAELIELSYLTKQGKCQKENQDLKSEAVCLEKADRYVLAKTPEIQMPLDPESSKSLVEAAKQRIADFGVKYPQELVAELTILKVAAFFAAERTAVEQALTDISFQLIDDQLRLLFERIQKLLREARNASDRMQIPSSDPLKRELAIFSQFESLKKQYRGLVADAIGTVFDRKSKEDVLRRARAHAKQSEELARAHGVRFRQMLVLMNASKTLVTTIESFE